MAHVDRNNPVRAESSDSDYTLLEFMRDFPDDATCLDWLWRTRYAEDGEHAHCEKCGKTRSFKRYATTQRRQSWTKRIKHAEKVYVSGDVHTNTIEGFWALLKNGIRGVYHSVSAKHLQGYLSEYVWRWNHRDEEAAMFLTLLLRAAKP